MYHGEGGEILIAEQPSGELLRIERWVYEAWIRRSLRDPFLCAVLDRAVDVRRPRWNVEVLSGAIKK